MSHDPPVSYPPTFLPSTNTRTELALSDAPFTATRLAARTQ